MKSLAFSGLSALVILGFSPLNMAASAQVFSSQRAAQSEVLQATYERDETLYLDRDGIYEYDLVLQTEATLGGLRLPPGTVIRGQFEPAEGGLVYVANSAEVNNRIFRIDAISELMRDNKDPRQTSAGAIATDAAIGAAGGYVIGEVFGDAGFWEVAGGAAAGVLVGNTTAPLVVVIRPDQEIALYSN